MFKKENPNQQPLFTESPHYPRYKFFPDDKSFTTWLQNPTNHDDFYGSQLAIEIGWLDYSKNVNFTGAQYLASLLSPHEPAFFLGIDQIHFNHQIKPWLSTEHTIIGNKSWAEKYPYISPLAVTADCLSKNLESHLISSADQVLITAPDLVNQIEIMRSALFFTKQGGTSTIILSPTNIDERSNQYSESVPDTLQKVLAHCSLNRSNFSIDINGQKIDPKQLPDISIKPIPIFDYCTLQYPYSYYINSSTQIHKYLEIGVYVIKIQKFLC